MKHKSEHIFILESLSLVIVSHNSMLNEHSVGNVITELKNNPFFQEKYVVLIDIRNADTKISVDEIEKLSSFVYENLDGTDLKKLAILSTTQQINKTVQFVRNYKRSSKYQVFSTLDAALHWLKVPLQKKSEVEIKLQYLKN